MIISVGCERIEKKKKEKGNERRNIGEKKDSLLSLGGLHRRLDGCWPEAESFNAMRTSFVELGGSIAPWLAYLLMDQVASGSFPGIPNIFQRKFCCC